MRERVPQSENENKSPFTLLSDQPSETAEDQLGYRDAALRLANAVKQSRASTPLTIGIEGEWGLGKSTLMRCLWSCLNQAGDVETIWFNAWTAGGSSALEGLIKSVLYKLDTSALRRAARKTKLLGSLRFVLLLVGSWLGLRSFVDTIWDRANADARTRNELRGLVDEAVNSWIEGYNTSRERLLVVFIDDLDRASPSQALEVFEAIKVYLDVKGLVFVVGFDRTAVTNIVAESSAAGRGTRAREYLEKIVQITYRLRPPDDDQARSLLADYTARSNTATLFGDVERALVVERNQRNPRRMKRFLNAFVLAYDLDPDWVEIGPRSLVEVLLLEMHFPEFTNLFRARPTVDPATEFLRYADTRKAVETGQRGDTAAAVDLVEIERGLPEEFPLLARNDDFTALVRAMRQSESWPAVRAKLERRVSTGRSATQEEIRGIVAQGVTGASLLWIDDDPSANQALLEILEEDGWTVTQAQDGETAKQLLRQHHGFDLVISDCIREGRSDAGIEEMREIREQGLFQGPVIFYTLRVTPDLRSRVSKLDAKITNRLEDLLAAVRALRRS